MVRLIGIPCRVMTADDIIEALGGRKTVARVLGVSRTAPFNWAREGIPAHHWPDLVALAATLGIPGITFDALRATGRRGTNRERAVTTPRPDKRPARKTDTSDSFGGVLKIETVA